MLKLHYLPLFIPFLFLVVCLEWLYSKQHNIKAFKFESTVLNTSCGIIERALDVYIFLGLYLWMDWLYGHFAMFHFEKNGLYWLILTILLDFIIYWFHRGGHTINILWAAHVTHHQSEEFNYTVAFRNSILPHVFRAIPMSILPIFGFTAESILIALTISGIWQFFIHTATIRSLGWLEYFMTTPSHHRVHHASNPQYIDKNFGGMFIIWDRLFGTFQQENEEAKYGLKNSFTSLNPVRAFTHVYVDLYNSSCSTSNWKEKLYIWFGRPDFFYEKYVKKSLTEEVTNPISPSIIFYTSIQIVVLTTLLTLALVFENYFISELNLLIRGMLVVSVIIVCSLMENKRWTFFLEGLRLIACILILIILALPSFLSIVFFSVFILSLVWILSINA